MGRAHRHQRRKQLKMTTAAYLRELRKTMPKLAKKHGTPLFVISKTLLLEQVARFRRLLPRVEPFYAVKANPNQQVLKILADAGLGFDVASPAEIGWALAAGATPDRLVFANTMKRTEAIEFACQKKVNLMTFDSEYE